MTAVPRRRRRPFPLGALLWAGLLAAGAALSSMPALAKPADDQRVLRVCADPNNLPFSNRRLEGFENRIAALIAEELDAKLEYTWWAQRRGFLRNTLNAGKCDVVMGIPSSNERILVTRSYYRSTYVFLYRADSGFSIDSLDDSDLREVSIGVHLIGDDGTNTPPAHGLGRRGIVDNVVGYMIYGDYAEENPPARLVEAVAAERIDVAIVWGPFAGYFAPRQPVELAIRPVSPIIDIPALPYVYDISIGVRRYDKTLRSELNDIILRRREDIGRILEEFGVPRL